MTGIVAEKPKSRASRISVYDYTDYREFLKNYYHVQKRKNKAFSYRYFARKANINSSGFYKNVVDGKRSLGRSLILKFAEAMKLRKKETDYFENMVYFNEAKTVDEKRLYFERMMSLRKLDEYVVESSQYEFYSKWYYSAVRELIGIRPFKGDYAELAKALNPAIRSDQAEKAVKMLEKLNFIKKSDDGVYKQTSHVVTTGSEVTSLNVANFQITSMDLAREAIDRHPPEQRDMSTLTLSLSREAFDAMKDEIVAFRKKMLNLEQKFNLPDRVYQLNMHFFPLSKIEANK
jgi:uncharacterized protein (TIGR02147 family)